MSIQLIDRSPWQPFKLRSLYSGVSSSICVPLTPHVACIAIFQYIYSTHSKSGECQVQTNQLLRPPRQIVRSPPKEHVILDGISGSGSSTCGPHNSNDLLSQLNSDSTCTSSSCELHQRHFGSKSLRTNQERFFCRHAEKSSKCEKFKYLGHPEHMV